jgi:transcriptional regulator with XRE-family HTH domain
LRFSLGLLSYNTHVTEEELWREVGRALREKREQDDLNVTQVAKKAGIDQKTVKAIERGDLRQVDKLAALARALGMSIVDVLSAVLKSSEQRPTPEAATLLRCFEQLATEDRQVLLASVQRMFQQHEARTHLLVLVAKLEANAASAPGRKPKGPKTKPPRDAGEL